MCVGEIDVCVYESVHSLEMCVCISTTALNAVSKVFHFTVFRSRSGRRVITTTL